MGRTGTKIKVQTEMHEEVNSTQFKMIIPGSGFPNLLR
jgi:hypothetical protein